MDKKYIDEFIIEYRKERIANNGVLKMPDEYLYDLIVKEAFLDDISSESIINRSIPFQHKIIDLNDLIFKDLEKVDKKDLIPFIHLNDSIKKFSFLKVLKKHMTHCHDKDVSRERSLDHKDFSMNDVNRFMTLSYNVIEEINDNDELKLAIIEYYPIKTLYEISNLDVMSPYFSLMENKIVNVEESTMGGI